MTRETVSDSENDMLVAFAAAALLQASPPVLPHRENRRFPVNSDMPAEIPPPIGELPMRRVVDIDPKRKREDSDPSFMLPFTPSRRGSRNREVKNITKAEARHTRHVSRQDF